MCVFYVFGFIGRPLLSFFRIFRYKVDLALPLKIRGLRYQMRPNAFIKKSKKFQIQKVKEQPPSFVSNLLTFRTLSERGRYTRADTHSAILAR